MAYASLVRILHISDLQAGRDCLAESRPDRATVRYSYESFADKLADDVLSCMSGDVPDAVIFTGDVAATGNKREYESASFFLERLLDRLGTPWTNVALIPGNHDVNWRLLEREYKRQSKGRRFDAHKCARMPIKMSVFRKWFEGSYGGVYRYTPGQPLLFDKLSKPQLLLLGLDSCEGITYRPSDNNGLVSQDQLRTACELIEQNGADTLNVVMLHHNPFPFGKDRTGLREAEGLLEALDKAGAHVILSGHMHRSVAVAHVMGGKRQLRTLVTGPCCMRPEHRTFDIPGYSHQEVLPNRYQLIEINLSDALIKVMLRRFSFERLSRGTHGAWTSYSDPSYAEYWGEFTSSLPVKGIVKPKEYLPFRITPDLLR